MTVQQYIGIYIKTMHIPINRLAVLLVTFDTITWKVCGIQRYPNYQTVNSIPFASSIDICQEYRNKNANCN